MDGIWALVADRRGCERSDQILPRKGDAEQSQEASDVSPTTKTKQRPGKWRGRGGGRRVYGYRNVQDRKSARREKGIDKKL